MSRLIADYHVQTVKDVPAGVFIESFAQHLKTQGKIEIPKWAEYVKTAVNKELAPYSEDWMYVRAAAILRKVYTRPNTGVGALRVFYGSASRRGVAPSHFQKAAGKINRYLLQQLEKIGLVEASKHVKGGRRVTKQGQMECDNVAVQLNQVEKKEE